MLKGRRMPVSAIFENLEAGATLDDIMKWHDGLDREQVKAVIELAGRGLGQRACPHSLGSPDARPWLPLCRGGISD